ncbi:hypothetical protein ACFYO0_44565 [Streptomyces sp. NPDC006365]|uniref:hypothetical protein n=1 Tax=Streptomyces sp. NPDC006365 TaxID=3364744 RepID=UPI0036B698F4
MPVTSAPAALPRFRHRWAAVAGLLVPSPISAEYLIGYGESTGRPLELLAGLLILTALYGTVLGGVAALPLLAAHLLHRKEPSAC